ncbi:hypothetical protein [Caproicibacter sp.]|uniref:hypothetical protein n=1 Tax=Caproicibacter sp. TaxID=2814884 RepID=UPI0039891319
MMRRNEYGTKLVLAATAFALDISRELSADEMNVLGAFLNVVGDQLSLMAASEVSEPLFGQNGNGKDGG